MRHIRLVFINEIVTTLSRPSFLFATFGIPLLGYVWLGATAMLGQNQISRWRRVISAVALSPTQEVRIGLVDPAGIVHAYQGDAQPYHILPYPDEAAALQALRNQEISAFAVISEDYLLSGKVRYVQDGLQLNAFKGANYLERLLRVSVLDDPLLADLIDEPLAVHEVIRLGDAPDPAIEENSGAFLLPYVMGVLFFLLIVGTATMALNGMEREKRNRVLEILLTSVTPQELLGGKILALGVLGLLQTVAWFGGTILLVVIGRATVPNFLQGVSVSPGLLGWGSALFLGGFLFNSSILGVAGALTDSAREASQVSMWIVLSAILPLLSNSLIIASPNEWLALVLSFIPMTAPIAMVMRMTVTPVAWWQPALALLLLLGSSYLLLWAAGRALKGHHLLAGGEVNIRRLVRVMRGQE